MSIPRAELLTVGVQFVLIGLIAWFSWPVAIVALVVALGRILWVTRGRW